MSCIMGPFGETNLILNIHGYVAFLSSEMMRRFLTVHLIMQAVDSLDLRSGGH